MGAIRDHLLSREGGGRSSEQSVEAVLKISPKLSKRYFERFLYVRLLRKYKRRKTAEIILSSILYPDSRSFQKTGMKSFFQFLLVSKIFIFCLTF